MVDFRLELTEYLTKQFPAQVSANISAPPKSPRVTRKVSLFAKKRIDDATAFLQEVFPGCKIGYKDSDPKKDLPIGKKRVAWSTEWTKTGSVFKFEYELGAIPNNGADFLKAVLESRPSKFHIHPDISNKIESKIHEWRAEEGGSKPMPGSLFGTGKFAALAKV